MKDTDSQHWAGIDWGDVEHSLCVVDSRGETVVKTRIPHCTQGVRDLVQTLLTVPGLAGVAIETSRHLLVDALLDAGVRVYAVNPQMSTAWRKCYSVAAPKSDDRDAWTLAQGLRAHQHALRPIKQDTQKMGELAMLCEHEQSLIAKRTACACELKSLLKLYYPAVLGWFSAFTLLSSWDFIIAFPTPQALAAASKTKLCGFFKSHRMALNPKRLDLIDRRAEATILAAEPVKAATYALRVQAVARELRAIQNAIHEYEKLIKTSFRSQPQAEIFMSLPGAGRKLAPRLMVILGANLDRYQSAQDVAEFSGPAPVTVASGNGRRVKFRRSCKKNYRNTMHQFAWTSLKYCPWANAFYKACRERRQSNALALRNLACKWLKIIFRMWQENAPYDDRKYRMALKRANSPLAARLGI